MLAITWSNTSYPDLTFISPTVVPTGIRKPGSSATRGLPTRGGQRTGVRGRATGNIRDKRNIGDITSAM